MQFSLKKGFGRIAVGRTKFSVSLVTGWVLQLGFKADRLDTRRADGYFLNLKSKNEWWLSFIKDQADIGGKAIFRLPQVADGCAVELRKKTRQAPAGRPAFSLSDRTIPGS